MSSFDRTLQERLIGRGATLDERLSDEALLPLGGDAQAGEQRLRRWREACEKFDPQGFARRLAWAGIDADPAVLAGRLGPVSPAPHVRAPRWVEGVAAIASLWGGGVHLGHDAWMEGVPFAELIGPLVTAAERELRAHYPAYAKRFGEVARGNLLRALADDIADHLAPALQREFSLFRVRQGVAPEACGPGQADLYRAFIANLRGDDGPVFIVKYAGAARAVARRLETWRWNTGELAERLERDMRDVIPPFLGVHPDAVVRAVNANLSDHHDGGQSVVALEFGAGQRLFYKPRQVRIEALLHEVAGGLQRARPGGPRWSRYIAPVLDRGDYGWSKGIAAAPEMTRADAADYFTAAGEALAFAYAFGGADLHDENIVASRGGPVLVDAEVFAAPRPGTGGRPVAEFTTVLRTGLLPQWISYGDGQTIQIAGYSGGRTFLTGYREKVWRDINTDAMRIETREVVVQAPDENCVRLTGARPVGPADFQDEILAGFRNGYRHLAEAATDARWRAALRTGLRDVPVRFLLRSTNIYATLRQRVLDPRFAAECVDRDLEFEPLLSPYLVQDAPPPAWPVILEERRQWISGDIPRFEVSASSRDWACGSAVPLFTRSGLECVDETLDRLGPEDKSYQSDLISLTLRAAEALDERNDGDKRSGLPALNKGLHDPWRASVAIADRILAAAKEEEGALFWIGSQFDQTTSRYRIETLGPDLYDGFCGIALFLALMARLSGEERFASAARLALQPAFRPIATRQWNAGLDDGQGAVTGRASAAWAIAWVAQLLDDRVMLGFAREHADRVVCESIASPDLFTGLAGVLLCLDAVGDAPPRAGAVSRLIDMVDLDSADLGASHGLAGIMYGLEARLADEPRALELSRKIRARIVSAWDPALAGWRGGGPSVVDNWNHGSAGIAHLLLKSRVPRDAVLDRIIAATLDRLEGEEPLRWDHLGSGNAGLVSLWNAVGRRACARRSVEHMLSRAGPGLAFELPLTDRFSHGLFTGGAGIGLALAQYAEPDRTPDFLTWPAPGLMAQRRRKDDHAAV